MNSKFKIGLCAAALTCVAATAQAITLSPVGASCGVTGGTSITADQCGGVGRDDINAVNLGAADGNFFSLGLQTGSQFGGVAIFNVAPNFMGPTMALEVTNGNSGHFEAADVYVATAFNGTDLTGFTAVGRVDNGMGGTMAANNTLNFGGIWNFIAFQDASFDEYGVAGNKTADGYDLDSFTVSAVPLPAGGLLLLTAMGGAAALRRRKKTAPAA